MSTELILASVIFVTIGLILVAVFVLTRFIGPKNENSEMKNSVYESGVTSPIGTTNIRFSVKFYLVAISFLLFKAIAFFSCNKTVLISFSKILISNGFEITIAMITAKIIRGVACRNSLPNLSLFRIVETIKRSRLKISKLHTKPKSKAG